MQACLNGTGLCTGHSTVVDGITPHKSPLFKRGRNVVMEVILPHFRVRPFCVVVSSSPWNRRSWVRISEPELTRHSALQFQPISNGQLHIRFLHADSRLHVSFSLKVYLTLHWTLENDKEVIEILVNISRFSLVQFEGAFH